MLNEKELIEIIEKALELKEGTIKSGDEDWYSLWDSLGHLSILVKLDQALGGKCSRINELSKASGANGMVGGQMLDLDAEKKKLSLSEILMLQKLKTGELFRFSCVAGPILSEQKDLKHFEEFAKNLGLAFQIKDDLLDVEGDEKQMGKKTKKDFSRGKETLISYLGKEDAKKKSEDLINDSKQILKFYGKRADRIIDLTNFVISRNN